MFFKGLPLTIRLNYQTISFKNIITGGWAHRFQASVVNKDNSYLFLLVDRASPTQSDERYMFRLSRSTSLFLCRKNCTFFSRVVVTKLCRLQRRFHYVKLYQENISSIRKQKFLEKNFWNMTVLTVGTQRH